MSQGFSLIVFPVKDLAGAKAFYSALLGVAPYADGPYYVGFRVEGQEIGLDPNAHGRGVDRVISYRQVDDIAASVKSLQQAGATVQQDVSRVGPGRQIAVLKDADGNFVGLMQDG
jgi:predicted enzyme related to lactoylglutathione lyase